MIYRDQWIAGETATLEREHRLAEHVASHEFNRCDCGVASRDGRIVSLCQIEGTEEHEAMLTTKLALFWCRDEMRTHAMADAQGLGAAW